VASSSPWLYENNVAASFLWPLKWAFGALLLYVLLGLIALVVAFVFASYVWTDPIQASDALFQAEASRIASLVESGNHIDGVATLTRFAQKMSYWLFFKATTLHDAAYAYFAGYRVNRVDRLYLGQFIARNAREIYVAMNVIQVYGIRIGFVLASIPLLALLYLVAAIDGFTERYIRRACSGRESSDLNKIGRMAKMMFFAIAITLYLCLPVVMDPFWIIGPLALIFAVATRIQWQFYKKYL
jgi:integrating conjugative element membrane protein (TIGR03747 family)